MALQQAGFAGIQISIEDADFVYAQDEEWWSHGIRRRLERLEASVLEQVKTDMLHRVRVLRQSDGIHTLFRALCAMGTKPGP